MLRRKLRKLKLKAKFKNSQPLMLNHMLKRMVLNLLENMKCSKKMSLMKKSSNGRNNTSNKVSKGL